MLPFLRVQRRIRNKLRQKPECDLWVVFFWVKHVRDLWRDMLCQGKENSGIGQSCHCSIKELAEDLNFAGLEQINCVLAFKPYFCEKCLWLNGCPIRWDLVDFSDGCWCWLTMKKKIFLEASVLVSPHWQCQLHEERFLHDCQWRLHIIAVLQ